MESYKHRGIKEIIAEFPQVGDILEEYDIGCGPCTVGICQLKDIVDIHKMEPEKEQELMARIEATIYPQRGVSIPAQISSSPRPKAKLSYSPPMQRLVDEHLLIKRWLALIPFVVGSLDLTTVSGLKVVEDGIDLIRSYADRLHHAKEEEILFKYFDDSAEIFQVIYEDHRQARNHVKEMLQAIDKEDESVLAYHLSGYAELLAEHIKKEDEILFPWLDRKLTGDQLAELTAKFDQEELKIGIDTEKYKIFIERLEGQSSKKTS